MMKKTLVLSCLGAVASLTMACATAPSSGGLGLVDSEGEAQTSQTTDSVDLPACAQILHAFTVKSNGSLEVLSSDGQIYNLNGGKTAKETSKLNGPVEDYVLMPTKGLILHFLSDKVMLEKIETGQELLKLEADPMAKTVHFSSDQSLMALRAPNGKYKLWNIHSQFENISPTETIETFMNRQRAEHQMGFPEQVSALHLGNKSSAAVAIDDLATQRLGLIYYMNEQKEPGKLKVLARSNTTITSIALSGNEAYVAALDNAGQFYFAQTDEKEFRLFARAYTNVKAIGFVDNDPFVIQASSLERISSTQGNSMWKTEVTLHECQSANAKLYCRSDAEILVINPDDGKILERHHFCQ